MRAVDSRFEHGVPTRSVATNVDRLAWALAACVVAIHVALLWRFAVDWPLHDDFTQIVALPGYLVQLPALRDKLELITALALEHRAATVRVAGLIASEAPGGIDFRVLIALGNGLALGSGFLAVLAYPRAHRGAAALLAALLLTSLTHYAAQYHATGGLQHFGVAFYALASLFALSKAHRAVAAAFALAAIFTSGSGLLVLPCAAVLTWLSGRRKEAVAWAVAAGIVMATYFIGYQGPASQTSVANLAGDPLHAIGLGLAALGSIGAVLHVSVVIGAVIVSVWSGLVMSGTWRRIPPFVIASSLFFALSLAVIAAGRATFGIEAVLLSRYRIGSALLVLLSVAALATVLDTRGYRWIQRSVIVSGALLYAMASSAVIDSMVDLHVRQFTLRDHFAADGSGHYEGYRQEWGDFTLRRASELGVYRGERKARSPAAVGAAQLAEGPGPGVLRVNVYPGTRVLSVVGVVEGAPREAWVWLRDDDRTLRGALMTVRYLGARLRPQAAFHGTMSMAGVAPGRYRIGVSDDVSTGIAWSRHDVEVR